MDNKPVKNVYLEQVLQEQQVVERKLKKNAPQFAALAPMRMQSMPAGAMAEALGDYDLAPSERRESVTQGKGGNRLLDYRITGLWLWKSVIVPPNVYVIHTRRGHEQPIHLGMGISFRFNPLTDAFLIIPSSVQTILINANCICQERQGILVQAYVQWMIADLKTAYWKLDFSDPDDPMGIVNLQLREQAEAAIKDKVATMSIDEVLSDKQPIIEELTDRLQTVAEGKQDGDGVIPTGLGLKIVTVQIKHAVVSSARLWENIQKPFRVEREKLARLAELENQEQINIRERENRVRNQTAELNASAQIEQLQSEQERLQYDRVHAENLRREQLEEEAKRQTIQEANTTAQQQNEAQLALVLQQFRLEQQRLGAEQETIEQQIALEQIQAQQQRAKMIAELELQELQDLAAMAQQERNLDLQAQANAIANDRSEAYLQSLLIEKLPDLAANLPAPQEQRTTIISDHDGGAFNNLLTFLASSLQGTQNLFSKNADPPPSPETEPNIGL